MCSLGFEILILILILIAFDIFQASFFERLSRRIVHFDTARSPACWQDDTRVNLFSIVLGRG